jgi:hypothetical protein
VRVHDAVVVHHSDHQATRERVPVQQSDSRHGVSQQSVPEAIESLREKPGGGSGVLEVQAVGVEFGEGRGCDYDAWRVFGLDDVEGEVQGFAEDLEVVVRYGFLSGDSESWEAIATDGCETVVWRTCEGEQVDFCRWLGDGHFARGADGDFEESGSHSFRFLFLIFKE